MMHVPIYKFNIKFIVLRKKKKLTAKFFNEVNKHLFARNSRCESSKYFLEVNIYKKNIALSLVVS
jgi:hypothetical protein